MGHKKTSSKRLASEAARKLASQNSTKAERSLAGSVLAQSRGKHSAKRRRRRPTKRR